MSYYPSRFIEKVRLSSDIVSLIAEDTALKGKGDRFMGLCPFAEHNEKTPSFSVSGSKQVYYCFGCQNSGNIFTYLQKQRGMNFSRSVEYLARKQGLELPQPKQFKSKASGSASIYSQLLQLSEDICCFYENNLKKASVPSSVTKYLKTRGWTPETIRAFRLGYAPKTQGICSFLTRPQKKRMAVDLGLVNRSNTGDHYDTFRHRLIFPIFSTRKQVVGFGARTLDAALPKYINSRESPIFHKGQIFYGLHESSRYLRQKSSVLIVEGYTDFLSLWQKGFKNLVATLGTALTQNHASILKQYVDSVVLVFDGDEAGFNASERSLPILLSAGLKVKLLSFSQGMDPDDFIRANGSKAFEEKLKRTEDLFFIVLQNKYKEFKEKGWENIHFIQEMLPFLDGARSNKILYNIYKQRFLDLFGSDAGIMEKALNEKLRGFSQRTRTETQTSPEQSEVLPVFSLVEALDSERMILVLCLESEEFLKQFIAKNVISLLRTPSVIRIFKKIIENYRQTPNEFDKNFHLIVNKISESRLIFKNFYPILRDGDLETQDKVFQDCVDSLKNKKKYSEASEILAEMKMKDKESFRHLEKVFQLTKQRLKPQIK